MIYYCKIGLEDSEDENTNRVQQKKQPKDSENSNNPLLTDLDFRDKKTKKIHKAELWFEKDAFKNLEHEDDADYELDKMIEQYKRKGGHILGEEKKTEEKINKEEKKIEEKINKKKRKVSESDDTNSDYDIEEMMASKKKIKKVGGKDGFEVVSQEKTGKMAWSGILPTETTNDWQLLVMSI